MRRCSPLAVASTFVVLRALTTFALVAPGNALARTLLIVAPHPDDDLLYGAGVAAAARARGDTVKVLYMTNGDVAGQTTGLRRQTEAVAGQSVIGGAEDDLILLGYPDTGHLSGNSFTCTPARAARS